MNDNQDNQNYMFSDEEFIAFDNDRFAEIPIDIINKSKTVILEALRKEDIEEIKKAIEKSPSR